MTLDVVSMEHSKSFIFALQELKNLRPQLYSAAEYCEKSYLHSDKKQVVLDNLKDYAVRALINAVDHLGTVAYKLNDLLEQQTFDVSTMELKVSTLNQKLLTCHVYTDKEGLRQQQLLAFVPRHHKHYILPKLVFLLQVYYWGKMSLLEFLALMSILHLPPFLLQLNMYYDCTSPKESKFSAKTSGVFHLLDSEERTWMKPSAAQLHITNGTLTSRATTQTCGVTGEDALKGSKPLTKFGSFDDRNGREAGQVHSRSKSVLSALFMKQKAAKLKAGSVL
ncbi:hypothetical protein ACSQ67_012281 [Phaseolus vulgaris]